MIRSLETFQGLNAEFVNQKPIQPVTPFDFEGALIRTLVIDGEPWFVGKDVAERLGYADPTTAIRSHCRGVQKLHPIPDALGRPQNVRILSEPDVLRLIVGSKLPEAEKFERWIFEEVLPTLRRTGTYSMGQSVTNISPEMRGVIGGIAKGVVLKALNDRLEPVELAVVKLHEMIKEIAAPSGQFKTSKEYTPAVSLADEACVPQRGRGGLVRRMSNRLDRYCRREGIPVRSEAHTDRRLFHVDAAAAWMAFEGRHIIRMHLDRLNGQEVMAFSKKGTH